MRKASYAALRLLDAAVMWIAAAGFIVMMLAVVGQVVFRYVLEMAVPWTEELARLLFVQSMLFGMAIAIRRHEHIVVDFLFNKLPPRGRDAAALLFDVAILLLLALLMRGSWALVARGWSARLVSLPWISVGTVYLGLFVALGLMAFYTVLNVGRRLAGAAEAPGVRVEGDA